MLLICSLELVTHIFSLGGKAAAAAFEAKDVFRDKTDDVKDLESKVHTAVTQASKKIY